MNASKALTIVRMLADGVDPQTGKEFPESSPYQQPDTIRALHVATESLQAAAARVRRRRTAPNAGAGWTEAEEKQLCAAFEEGASVSRLARIHGRTPGAIETRLMMLGKIEGSPYWQERIGWKIRRGKSESKDGSAHKKSTSVRQPGTSTRTQNNTASTTLV